LTVAALYTKHRSLAGKLARHYDVPGCEAQDVRQEAEIALWIAARNWDPEHGAPFGAFATVVIRRRLSSVLRAALAQKSQLLSQADRDGIVLLQAHTDDVERISVDRERLRRIVDGVARLSPNEREGIRVLLNGETQSKRTSNAVQRARHKLREAA
jgi:RNA polymerase sigma factor (sigma-70 family)